MADIVQLGNVLTDRGSKYAVSGCPVGNRAEVDAALKSLKRCKSYAKATHNTWAVLLSDGGALKGDDGEAGAGMVIVRMLEREALQDHFPKQCGSINNHCSSLITNRSLNIRASPFGSLNQNSCNLGILNINRP